ncbi:HalOD1 output domain-containing protein [Natrialbaceae archaeon A-arb3/5]
MAGGSDSVDRTVRQLPSQAVIRAVAEAEGIPPEELRPPEYEPLHSVIDPDALDALFAEQADGRPRPAGDVSFVFCGYEVVVSGTEAVTLDLLDENERK